MTLQAIKWEDRKLSILDQLQLPLRTLYRAVTTVDEGWSVINKMQVRGAPAIAIVGCLSLAAEISQATFEDKAQVLDFIASKLDHLVTARPTAVNMANAAEDLKKYTKGLHSDSQISAQDMVEKTIEWCEKLLADDVATNKKLSDLGATSVMDSATGVTKVRVLTHCNTGTLATAGYGTALGVIRSLHAAGNLEHVFCTETRPYNQGARLTAYELVFEGLPGTLICDSAAAWLMQTKGIHAILVGADRVDSKGNTANKIGTFQLAVAAKHFSVPFYVCAPTTSIDTSLDDGHKIPIEQRPSQEMTHIAGTQLAAPGINCWNPAFDVTPAELITGGIVTEHGVFRPQDLKSSLDALSYESK